MKILDLFAGIGGFSLAAHWVGWETAAFVEWDAFNQKVLAKNFPNTPIHGDIREFDGTKYRGAVDLVCGGFPCQPFSSAGQRKGTEDDRYLWPEMLRIIREVQPAWVVGENVAGIVSMDGGSVLCEILSSLEGEGYNVQTFLIPALSVGAPHRRDRVWIVANNYGPTIPKKANKREKSELDIEGDIWNKPSTIYKSEIVNNSPDTPITRFQNGGGAQVGQPGAKQEFKRRDGIHDATQQWHEHWLPVATRICGMDDGLPRRVDRAKRLKALGNAIVPQVAYEIFKAIKQNL